jgi:hypothetical protein
MAMSTFSVIHRRLVADEPGDLLGIRHRWDQDRDGTARLDLDTDAAAPRAERHVDLPFDGKLEVCESRPVAVLAVQHSPFR